MKVKLWSAVRFLFSRAASGVVGVQQRTGGPLIALPHRHFPALPCHLSPLYRHFAAHPSVRRKRKLKPKEELGKKKAMERTLRLFEKQSKKATDKVEEAARERDKGINLKQGTPLWNKEVRDRELREEAAKRELDAIEAKTTALRKKYEAGDYS